MSSVVLNEALLDLHLGPLCLAREQEQSTCALRLYTRPAGKAWDRHPMIQSEPSLPARSDAALKATTFADHLPSPLPSLASLRAILPARLMSDASGSCWGWPEPAPTGEAFDTLTWNHRKKTSQTSLRHAAPFASGDALASSSESSPSGRLQTSAQGPTQHEHPE